MMDAASGESAQAAELAADQIGAANQSLASPHEIIGAMGARARDAARVLARAPAAQRDLAVRGAAARLRADTALILAANDADSTRAEGLTDAQRDRLRLTPERIAAMADALDAIANQPDPLGHELARWVRPNGLRIVKRSVPLGVIGVIFEARPNVSADAGALCVKSGNAAILRAGSESLESARAIVAAIRCGLLAADLPEAAVQLVDSRERAMVGAMLAAVGGIDVLVPRGGPSLVARVQAESRLPVLAHLQGNNHVYVHASADPDMACSVVVNAKLRRVGICGAAETLLIDRSIVPEMLPSLITALHAGGCALRGCPEVLAMEPGITPAAESDWDTEYLAPILAIRVVGGLEEALAHIARHGSQHTEAIITADCAIATRFLESVDAAIVLVNASTQFADGGEFGMGAEIGIATGRLHARGPVGAAQLTSYKYEVWGNGHCRP